MKLNISRVLALILALTLVFALCCPTVAYATSPESTTSGDSSDSSDVFDKAGSLLDNIRKKVLGISSAVCGMTLVIAVCIWGFSNDKQKVAAAWAWVKRIVIAYVAINCITTVIIPTINNLSGIH